MIRATTTEELLKAVADEPFDPILELAHMKMEEMTPDELTEFVRSRESTRTPQDRAFDILKQRNLDLLKWVKSCPANSW